MKKINYYLLLFVTVLFFVNATGQNDDLSDPTIPIVETSTNATIPNTATRGGGGSLIYDNGPHFNIAGSPNISLLQNETLGMNTLGYRVDLSDENSMADDFTLDEDTEITSIDLYCHQTGASDVSTITAVYVQIWDGNPTTGGTVIWGDLTTNIIETTGWSDTYRVSEDFPLITLRAIFITRAVTEGLSLTAGTYWLEWTSEGDPTYLGPYQPPIAILGQAATGNALRRNDTGTWRTVLDSGTGDPQGLPFQLYGNTLGVDENTLNTQIIIFPNPAQSDITISNTSNISLERADIYNVEGKLINTVDLSEMTSQKTIDVSTLAKGLYMITISSESSSITKRFIKK